MAARPHPYYPRDLKLPGGYEPMYHSYAYVIGCFTAVFTAVGLISYVYIARQKHVSVLDRAMFLWFVISGGVHLIVEGYFSLNPMLHADKTGNILADLWKEYSKCDSRYVARDSYVVSMETFTAFAEGPGCLLIAYAIASVRSWRYPLQLLVSGGQVYGNMLYMWTLVIKERRGAIVGIPPSEDPFYFWFYYIFMNSIWYAIPAAAIAQAWFGTAAAVEASAQYKSARIRPNTPKPRAKQN